MTEKIKKTAKRLTDSYSKPTPRNIRKIGDSIFALGSAITGISAITMPPWVTVVAAFLTWAGKTITNFAS